MSLLRRKVALPIGEELITVLLFGEIRVCLGATAYEAKPVMVGLLKSYHY